MRKGARGSATDGAESPAAAAASAHPDGAESPAAAAPDAPDPLVRSLGGFAKFLLHAGGRDFYRAVGELDLNITQIRTLHLLAGPLPEASLKELADEIGLSMPAVSRSVEALVQRGLVTRTENATDRRLKAVKATEEARALVDHLIDLRAGAITDFVSTLTDEQRTQLDNALAPIVAREDVAPLCIARKDPETPHA